MMEKNRIVTEFFLERPNFDEVSRVAKLLEAEGLKPTVAPPDRRKINAHLIVEQNELEKARKVLEANSVSCIEKEVILIVLDNRPGTLAQVTTKVSSKGINLIYAFAVAMTPQTSYLLLGTEDNEAALKALGEN